MFEEAINKLEMILHDLAARSEEAESERMALERRIQTYNERIRDLNMRKQDVVIALEKLKSIKLIEK